ncbi:phage tail tape measure protein [Paenibacillus silviterrae]|uniref:phage tail tape measure protein n=2 Tax=Paenibacillus silviterrae TaxID=3242194 RepID=UPI0025439AA7|nr:phage tail tape measure protein [Paenibacillus chinjuensis]
MGIIGNLMFAVGFKVTNKAVQNADKDLQNLRRSTDEVDDSITGLGRGFSMFASVSAGALDAVAVGVATLGYKAFNAAREYEQAMGRIEGATGSVGELMDETRGIAARLYEQNYGENWGDLAGSISLVKQITKETGDQLEETARNAMLLRDNPDIGFEITESLRAARGMMKNFGIESDAAYNLMAQGAQQGLNANGNLLDSANEYSVFFKSLGFSANEMFDVFGAGMENGAFDLDKVGDAVKEFNIRAKDGSKTTIEAYQMLGLNAEEMMQTFARGGPEAKASFSQIMQMIDAIEDPVERNTVGVSLMGTQFEDLEAGIVSAMGSARSQFDMTKDTMEELNRIKLEEPGHAMQIFWRQFETGILIPIGDRFLPVADRFQKWVIGINPAIQSLGQVIVTGIGIAFAISEGAISGVSDAIQWSTQFFEDHQFAISITAGIITAFFLPALISSGVQATIAGAKISAGFIASMATTAWQATVTGATITGQLVMAMLSYAAQGWATATSIALTTSAWIAQRTVMAVSTGLTWAMTAAQWALNAAFWANPMTWVIAGIVALIAAVVWMVANWDMVKEKAFEVWGAIRDAWGRAMDFLESIDLVQIGKDILNGLIHGITSMGSAVWDAAKGIGKGIKDSITGFLDIHSPSRVMMEVGFWTGEGLIEGLAGTESDVSGVAGGLAEEAVAPFEESQYALPSTMPATATQANPYGSSSNITIQLVVEVKGTTPISESNAINIADGVKPVLVEAVESAIRRLGLDSGMVEVET